MVKCPFCHYDNEDGALFCEQCKSDLSSAEPVKPAAAVPAAVPLEGIPMAAVAEASPIMQGVVMEATVAEAVMPLAGLAGSETVPMAVPMADVAPVVSSPESAPAPPASQTAPMTPPPATAPTAPPLTPASAPTMSSAPPAAPAGAAPAGEPAPLPAGAQPRLIVLRGQKRNVEYPIYEGHNFLGRADEKPVDIDLEDQEPPDRIWSSRQHALITLEEGKLFIEDLNSSNGTFVNRGRIYPGQKRPLAVNDVVQIGTVQLKLIV